MYAASVWYISDSMSTKRTRILPVFGSIMSPNGIGTSRPAWIVTIALLPPSRRNRVAQ